MPQKILLVYKSPFIYGLRNALRVHKKKMLWKLNKTFGNGIKYVREMQKFLAKKDRMALGEDVDMQSFIGEM